MKKIKLIPLTLTTIFAVSIFTGIVLANSSSLDKIGEEAGVFINTNNGLITVTLSFHGQNYNNGYEDYEILINDQIVQRLPEKFVLAESISIGEGLNGFVVDGHTLSEGKYQVTIIVLGTTIFDGTVTVY